MTSGQSSCRPARLERFDETVGAMCDGLAVRAGLLEDALSTYRASCDVGFRAPTTDTVEVVRAAVAGLRDIGEWTGAVGGAFRRAVEDAGVLGWFSLDGEMTLADAVIADDLDEWSDPYRGVPEGMAAQLAEDLGLDYDPDGPPAWVDLFADGATVGDVLGPLLEGTAMGVANLPPGMSVTLRVESSTVAVLADGTLVARLSQTELSASLMLPGASAARLSTASTWLWRVGFAMALLAGAGEQWHADGGLPTQERVARAVTRGVGVAGGSAAGGAAGVQLGAVCGPAMPACSAVFGIAGAVAGGVAGDAFVEQLPWMDSPPPGEHDLEAIAEGIAADGGSVNARLQAQADLQASDLAVLATADDPVLNRRVVSIVPDDDVLERIVAFDDASAPPRVSTGTTTTTTGVPPAPHPSSAPGDGSPLPDPWVGDRIGER